MGDINRNDINMHDIKLIISDMDGTLLNSDKVISKENLQAIARLQQCGITFAIATGRNYHELSTFLPQFARQVAVISLNGGLIYDEKGIAVECHPFAVSELSALITLLTEQQVYFELLDDNHFYSNSSDNRLKLIDQQFGGKLSQAQIMADYRYKMTQFVDYQNLLAAQQNIYKIRVFDLNNTDLQALSMIIQSALPCEISSSAGFNIEINPHGVSKGQGIISLKNYYQLQQLQIMAIGDNLNDLSMIDQVGIFCAMGNSHKTIIEQSHIQTVSNDDHGVAQIIEKVLIQYDEFK